LAERNFNVDNSPRSESLNATSLLQRSLEEHLQVVQGTLQSQLGEIERAGALLRDTLKQGHKVLICGNGGSAADAQHIAAELVGRYERQRRAWPAIALTTDTSTLTAISNDYGYEEVFARQVEALAVAGDVLLALSTSGTSANVLKAVKKAHELGCKTIALTGAGGERLAAICDLAVVVPASRTARVQECHITIGHLWCELIEAEL
jgi:D-sedoheptulose 7-phosphate isomerase